MKKGSICIFDSLIVLLNISSPYTILPSIIFTKQTGANSAIIFVITLVYALFRFNKRRYIPKDKLLGLFLFLNIYNLINAYSQGTFAIGFLATLIANTTFYFFLYNLYFAYRRERDVPDSIKLLIRGYIWLCIYQLFIVITMMFLSEAHVINPWTNDISNSFDIFDDNVSRGAKYYFPFNICVVTFSPLERLPFWHSYGVFTGIFHEPHTMTYYIVPFLFLMQALYGFKRLITLDVLFAIYMLVAASTTNIFCVLAVFCFWKCSRNKKFAIVFILFAYWAFLLIQMTDNPIIELVKLKLESGSMTYSASTFDFAFTPQSFWGTNFYDLSYLDTNSSKYDVGIIVFVLNLLFLAVLIFRTMMLCFSSNKLYMCVGLFAFYFILHSSKLALRTYSLEMLMFVIFLVNCSYTEAKRQNVVKWINPHARKQRNEKNK